VIARPGHEIRVHGWLEATRPTTFVLTNGGARDRRQMMASTAVVLDRAGARPGSVFGRLGDHEVSRALAHGDDRLLGDLLVEIADAFVALDVDIVVMDGEEGLDPLHDVCHRLATAAAERASRQTGRAIDLFDFPLLSPSAFYPRPSGDAVVRRLNDAALARKHRASQSYPRMYDELDRLRAAFGADFLRTEVFRPAGSDRVNLTFRRADVPVWMPSPQCG
jgi:hypothetical protein